MYTTIENISRDMKFVMRVVSRTTKNLTNVDENIRTLPAKLLKI